MAKQKARGSAGRRGVGPVGPMMDGDNPMPHARLLLAQMRRAMATAATRRKKGR